MTSVPVAESSAVRPGESDYDIAFLFVNYNTFRELDGAIRSLVEHPPRWQDGREMRYEIVAVDNASPIADPHFIEQVKLALAELPEGCRGELVMHDENSGYSKGMNLALDRTSAPWVVFSNPDILYVEGCISKLVAAMENNPEIGCAVPKGFFDPMFEGRLPPNTLPTIKDVFFTFCGDFARWISRGHSMRISKSSRDIWLATELMHLDMMSGCLFVMRRSYYEELGRLDERFPLYYEDADLSVRINASGKKLTQVADAHIVHLYNRSGQTDMTTTLARHDVSRRLYYRKQYGRLGLFFLDSTSWLRRSWLGKKLAKHAPHGKHQDLGSTIEAPVLRFGRQVDRFMLQISLDARFYLSGGLFGSGESWTPHPDMYANFTPLPYHYRAFALGADGALELLGQWTHVRVMPSPDASLESADEQSGSIPADLEHAADGRG